MDTAKWPQEFVVKPMNEIVTNTTTTTTCLKQPNPPPTTVVVVDTTTRKARPEKDEALNCPRCNSLNTKFCYYNNYSLTQPRYFCKDCRRYWTEGGSLRNIPIGGGVRKTKRSSSNSSSKKPLYNPPPSVNPQHPNPKIGENALTAAKVQDLGFSTQGGFVNNNVKDLNLAFSSQGFGIGQHHLQHHQSIPEFMQVLPSSMKHNNNPLVSTSSALELLGISSSNNNNNPCTNSSNNPRPPPPTSPFMPFPILQDSSLNYGSASAAGGRDMGFGMSYPQFQEFMRPTAALGFSLDGGGGGMYGGDPLHQEDGSTTTNTNGRPLLPFESLKLPVSSTSTNSGGNGNGNNGNDNNHHQNQSEEQEKEDGEQSVGYWSGMLSGASSSAGTGTGTASWQ